ncbi:MAG: MCE family protein [Paludibacteraceae bacterium]|nr:MCE family protein [Paludibacteraceae bacterium]MBO7316775.1 MCE family protein [Paludibacteraceae bacterium]
MWKKIFNREVKIGLMVVTALVVLFFGLNYLKGINIFKPTNHYYLSLEAVNGLVPSNPVYIKGYKIGQVGKIEYDFAKEKSFIIQIDIQDDVKLPSGTIAELFDDGLMGGKAINLVFSSEKDFHTAGDTLIVQVVPSLMDALSAELLPKISAALSNIDSLVVSAQKLLSSEEIEKTLISIESATADLSSSSASLKNYMQTDVPMLLSNIDTIASDFKFISSDLKQIEFDSLFQKIDGTIANLETLSESLNNKEGSLGLLINDSAVYNELDSTINSANALLKDLKENPKRYVHFSLFGRKDDKDKK